MSLIYTINRQGKFRHTSNGVHKCGTPHNAEYAYRVAITVTGKLKPPLNFIIDNSEVHDYFTRTYPFSQWKQGISCELMAERACKWLRLRCKDRGWEVLTCKVSITGSNWESFLEATWTKWPYHLVS